MAVLMAAVNGPRPQTVPSELGLFAVVISKACPILLAEVIAK